MIDAVKCVQLNQKAATENQKSDVTFFKKNLLLIKNGQSGRKNLYFSLPPFRKSWNI